MSALDSTVQRLISEEGFSAKAYRDTKGFLTIGHGFNVDAGITKRAAAALLRAQVDEVNDQLFEYDWYKNLDEVRKSAFLDMAFNEGIGSLLHFTKTIAAVQAKDWQTAHDEMLDSKWHKDVGDSRALPLANIVLTGIDNE